MGFRRALMPVRSTLSAVLMTWALVGCSFQLGSGGSDLESAAPTPAAPTASDAGAETSADESAPSSNGEVPIEKTPGGENGELAKGAAPPASRVDPNGYSYTVTEYLTWVIGDLDRKWTAWFTSRGYAEPQVQYVIINPGQSYRSRCSNIPVLTDTTPNAYYCPADNADSGTMWLPVTTFQKMWTGDVFNRPSQRLGDFAAAVITAHEFGHHVADELTKQSTAAGRTITPLTGANDELVADCFAGVWVATAYYDGKLEQGDVEEAIAALESIGDTAASAEPHGTPAERAAAMRVGYNTQADPTPCVERYWK